ncbi:beta-glucoside-specific PTS transporter subunit IIABC [Lacrimispora sp.]|jgi:PTS system beta-glucosides-specific IIC component|uniref:beta-glucoside-specific PTS transporter subunit IIABC n=1 Tax=Lacrimispora sp. TaxID=2719234 RepID=UPI00289DCDF3|nr:beta-glucoside-specific PTS transporter subunit IIABC [Lacrimispora sp.]
MDYDNLSKTILKNVGGEENILDVYHCITRLRFHLKDSSKVNEKEIIDSEGIAGAQFKGREFQVIIGNHVKNVYENLVSHMNGSGKQDGEVSAEKTNIMTKLMDTLAGVFVPVLPAITAAGMVKSVLALLLAFRAVSAERDIYQLFNILSDAAFYFLPFLLAVTSARKFKTNEFLALTVAGSLMYPTIITGAANGGVLHVFGITIPFINYSASIIPIVLSVWLLSKVYRFIDKRTPETVRLLIAPMLSLFIIVPISLGLVAPLGNYAGYYLASFLTWIFAVSGPVAGLILGAIIPLIVMTGMHYVVNPIVLQNLNQLGYDFIAPLFFLCNIAQAGATLAVFTKAKDKKLRSLALSTGISAMFGITEPAMYGVNIHEKKPFYASLIAGGIGGFVATMFGVKVYAFVMPGITGIPAYITQGGDNTNIAVIILSLLITFASSFGLTLILWKDKKINIKEEPQIVPEETLNEEFVRSPIEGEIVSLTDVPDTIFSKQIVGFGVAFIPESREIRAPFEGQVTMISESKHAISLKSKGGIELLIHVGIDSAKLGGVGFEVTVKAGDNIRVGDKLMEVNLEYLKEKGVDILTPVIVTNASVFNRIELLGVGSKGNWETNIIAVL